MEANEIASILACWPAGPKIGQPIGSQTILKEEMSQQLVRIYKLNMHYNN